MLKLKNSKYRIAKLEDLELLQINKFKFHHKLFLQYDNHNEDNGIHFFRRREFKNHEKIIYIVLRSNIFYAPKNFEQTLIIHAKYFDKTLSIVYVFIKKKKMPIINIHIFRTESRI